MIRNDFDLNAIDVEKPCTEDWAGMTGDDRARHCAKCEKKVYDLSAMTTEQARALILERRGDLCVRFYRRADGRLATVDCPTGPFVVQRRRLAKRAAAAALAVGALIGGNALAGPNGGMQSHDPGALEHAKKELKTEPAAEEEQVEIQVAEHDVAEAEPMVCELPSESVTYTVRADDTLQSIITQWKSKEEWIKSANPDADLTKLTAGQKLTVPYAAPTAAAQPMIMGLVALPPQKTPAPKPAPTQTEAQ